MFGWQDDGEPLCEEAAVDEELLKLLKQAELGLLVELRQVVQVKKSQEMAARYLEDYSKAGAEYEHSDKEPG